MDYSKYKFLSFDCYGTLIDWESGIWNTLQPIIMTNKRNDLTREKVLNQFAELEAYQQQNNPEMIYPNILFNVHQKFAQNNNLQSNDNLDSDFGNSVQHWPAFPDSADALRKLKEKFKLIILSNVNNNCFASSCRWLGVEFDEIYTAEKIGSYKPNLQNFKYMFNKVKEKYGEDKETILHVAQSLHHDHVPAKTLNMNTIWIDRQNLSKGGNWGATKKIENFPEPDKIFEDLISFAIEATNY